MVATLARMVSAFIVPPCIDTVVAAEQSAAADVGDQCNEGKEGEGDIEDVDHVLFEAVPAFGRAP